MTDASATISARLDAAGLRDDDANRRLLEELSPAGYVNPVPPAAPYDLVVLGGGTAGLVSAMGSVGIGARVALIERHLLGGDCLNFGCVPSKALLAAGHAAARVRDAARFGVHVEEPRIDAAAGLARVRELRARIAPHDGVARIGGTGVDVYLGHGRFVAPDAAEVGGARLRFKRAVICTGGSPWLPPVPGLADIAARTSDTIWELETVPAALVVMGGGPIGCEMAQAFGRLGSEVTIVEMAPALLPRDDPDAAELVMARFESEGVRVLAGHRVVGARRDGDARTLTVETSDGARFDVTGDEVLVAVGRRANTADIGAEVAGVEVSKRGVTVDARMRTTNRRIFAAGDVASSYQFTHAADAMARLVIRNAFFFGRGRADSLVIPWATYTDPEIAHVGVTHEQAAERGLQTFRVDFASVDRALLEGEETGFAKLYTDAKGRIHGATVVGPRAGDLIGEACLAMTAGLDAAMLSSTIHPYPTTAEVWRKLGDAYNKTRLSPGVRRLFAHWFRWLR